MKKAGFFKWILVGASVLLLAGCGGIGTGARSAGQGAGATGDVGDASQGAVASGVGTQSGFAGQGGGTSAALQAPHNQTYYFNFDRDSVHSSDITSVDAQANYLVGHSRSKVRLEGNTDERGSREYNVALGWRRARSVANQLKQDGVSAKQIQTVSYGEERPAATSHNEAAYQKNRRVELSYNSY